MLVEPIPSQAFHSRDFLWDSLAEDSLGVGAPRILCGILGGVLWGWAGWARRRLTAPIPRAATNSEQDKQTNATEEVWGLGL